jgi:monosaccharide-transporting ATPase
MESSHILRMEGVNKTFPGVRALSDVNFSLQRGEIHALMGENGAGKSTLIKVLTGVYKKDSGTMELNGVEITPKSPQEAQSLGISTVYQEVNLCPNLSVAENIFIGRPPKKWGRIDWVTMNKRSEEILSRLELYIDVKQQLSSYSVAIQQMVAIARAVDISSGVLILDEPTSSLDKNEVAQLFKVMSKLRDEGMGIVFVTHFLDQVYEISDRITVLRNGMLVGEYLTEKLPRTQLVSHMIGREWNPSELNSVKTEEGKTDEVFLAVQSLSKKGKVNPIDLQIHRGEVLGLAGLLGSGRTEIARLLFGIDKADEGAFMFGSKEFSAMYPKRAIEQGIGFCPEDRKIEGISGELTIRENIVLALQAKRGYFHMLSVREQKKIAQEYIEILKHGAANRQSERWQPAEGYPCALAGHGSEVSHSRRADAWDRREFEDGDS